MIRVKFPNVNQEWLETQARNHADQIAIERDYGDVDCGIDQLVVNLLRHEYTDYDADQSVDRHAAANRAISDRYPWLTAECSRQTERRATDDRKVAAQLADYLADQEELYRLRQETVAASRAVCGSFHIGQPVEVVIKGHHRCGTIVKVGRSRLTVQYQIKTGADRTAVVHASTVVTAA